MTPLPSIATGAVAAFAVGGALHGVTGQDGGVHHSLRAFNTATASANKIHDDAVAKRLGFRGGLVPGVDVFAYLCHLPVEQWGRSWLERGTIEARFAAPVYDGDEIHITGTDDAGMALELVDPSGAICATGRAELPEAAAPAPDPALWPGGPPPEVVPPVSEEALSTGSLGCIRATFHAERAHEYLAEVREDLTLFTEEGLAHPGWLLRFANYVLTANVRLGPWIHVESRLQLLGTVGDGDVVETRAIVTAVREHKGHRFVDLDVLQVVDDQPVARTAHTAIYQPRGT